MASWEVIWWRLLKNGGGKKSRATDKEPVCVRIGRLCGAKATLCLKRGNKKRVPSNDETLFTENG